MGGEILEKIYEKQMEEMKVSKLALKTSLPMVISMIFISLYGIVDTIFVSSIGKNALTAISLAYPIQNIITSIGLGTGIGINSLLARTLGEKKQDKVQEIIFNGVLLTVITWIFIMFFSIFGIKPFFNFFTNDVELNFLGTTYLIILSIFSIGTLFQITTEKILEAYGKTKESMIVQISGSIINLILDPILIYGLIGFPKLEIKGAAIATVIGQIIGMFIGIYFIIKNKLIDINYIRGKWKLNKQIVRKIYKVGIPTMILEIASSFIMLLINKILIGFSNVAVSVWGVYGKINKFILIIIYGFNYGMIPMIGYNYGAKKLKRVIEIIKYFLKISIIVTISGMLVLLIFPMQVLSIFEVSNDILQIGVPAFRILSLGFVFAGVTLVLSAVFQALGNATYSLIIALLRKIIIVLPIIYTLKEILGLNIVWWSFTIAEILTMIVAIILYKKVFNKLLIKDRN